MAFYSEEELKNIPFQFLGLNVKISTKVSIYNPEKISIGNNSRIDDFCVLSGNLKIGSNVHIATFCNLAGGDPGIEMKDFSGCAYDVHILSQSDDYTGLTLTNPTIPDKYKKETKKKVIIEKHVIIGAKSIIFPGVNLKEGSCIGAMSMVTKSTEPWKMYFGIPAKIIKTRKKDLLELEEKYKKENWNYQKKVYPFF